MKAEKLSIKFEVDTRPPSGGTVQEFLFQDPILFMISHFDMASLFATRLHAFLFRGYDKGRDYYDLFFFLRKKVVPSLGLFRAAAKQTHPDLAFPTLASVLAAIREKLEGMDETKALRECDIPFAKSAVQAVSQSIRLNFPSWKASPRGGAGPTLIALHGMPPRRGFSTGGMHGA